VLTVTNENITAGAAGFLSTFPADKRPTAALKDTIGSGIDINTPFGLTLLLTSVYAGASFMAIGEYGREATEEEPFVVLKADPKLKPTILIIQPRPFAIACSVLTKVLAANSSPLMSLAKRHKLAGLANGYVGKEGPFEWLVWNRLRTSLPARGHLVASLRAAFIVQDTPAATLKAEDIEVARTVLSVAVSRIFVSPYSTGPILATHLYDLRPTVLSRTIGSLPVDSIPHLGPPASNVEVVLKGDQVERVEEGHDPVGELCVRGPAIVKPVVSSGVGADNWMDLGVQATARADGTFVIIPQGAVAL